MGILLFFIFVGWTIYCATSGVENKPSGWFKGVVWIILFFLFIGQFGESCI